MGGGDEDARSRVGVVGWEGALGFAQRYDRSPSPLSYLPVSGHLLPGPIHTSLRRAAGSGVRVLLVHRAPSGATMAIDLSQCGAGGVCRRFIGSAAITMEVI